MANSKSPIPVPERTGSLMDAQQILWAFPNKLKIIQLGGKAFIAKKTPDTLINMSGVKAVFETLSLRTSSQRILEYIQAKEDHLSLSEILLGKTEGQRVEQQHAHRDLVRERNLSANRRRVDMTKANVKDKAKELTRAELLAKIKRLEETILIYGCRHDHDSLRIAFEAEKELTSFKPLIEKRPATRSC